MRILVIPDKFKGTLTARQAAAAMQRGWIRIRRTDRMAAFPMSDGGDGFGELLSAALDAPPRQVRTRDAAGNPIRATWWLTRDRRTAIVESARVIGLARLPQGGRHPFDLDTRGLGPVLDRVAESGAKKCIVGIGGSATNDAGFGMARALGWRFLDRKGNEILRWPGLTELHRIEAPANPHRWPRMTVAVDVQNPLLGPHGCSRIYGPQKGLRPGDFKPAEAALKRLARVLGQQGFPARPDVGGAGAAGGLGFGLAAFLNAGLEPGFRLFAKWTGLKEQLAASHLVLTGEGCIDASSIMGKGVGELVQLCRKKKIPCIGLAGAVRDGKEVARAFTIALGIEGSLTGAEQAMQRPGYWLARLAQQAAQQWNRDFDRH